MSASGARSLSAWPGRVATVLVLAAAVLTSPAQVIADDFIAPRGVAANGDGHVFVADTFNDRIVEFDSSGFLVRGWGRFGSGDGQFDSPRGIATNAAGHVFVADTGNDRIQEFDSSGNFIRKWGARGRGGPKPEIERLRLRPSQFRVKREPTRLGSPLSRPAAGRRDAGRGSTIKLRLNTEALVHFVVHRRRADSPRPRPPRRRGFDRNLAVGAGTVAFTGRLRGRSLKPGRYVLHARPVSETGRRLERVSAPFRIVAG